MPVYSAESQVKDLRSVVRSMIDGLKGARYIAYRLVLKDIRSDYSKSRFGLIWDFLDPLVLAGIFYAIERVGFINRGPMGIPYPVFIVYGFMLYHTFQESVTFPLDILKRSQSLLMQLKLAPETLILSVFFRLLFNSSFRIGVILVISLLLGSLHPPGFILFLLLFPAIIFSGMAIGLFLAPFNTIYNDVGRITKILLNPLRYATPVMYSLENFPTINRINPITALLDNLRNLGTGHAVEDLPVMWGWLIFFLFLFMAGWFIFHLSIPVLAEKA